jgi:hypothetical protein
LYTRNRDIPLCASFILLAQVSSHAVTLALELLDPGAKARD